jgi:hypothetical protein
VKEYRFSTEREKSRTSGAKAFISKAFGTAEAVLFVRSFSAVFFVELWPGLFGAAEGAKNLIG